MAPHFAVRTRCDAPDAAPDDDANGRAAHVKMHATFWREKIWINVHAPVPESPIITETDGKTCHHMPAMTTQKLPAPMEPCRDSELLPSSPLTSLERWRMETAKPPANRPWNPSPLQQPPLTTHLDSHQPRTHLPATTFPRLFPSSSLLPPTLTQTLSFASASGLD